MRKWKCVYLSAATTTDRPRVGRSTVTDHEFGVVAADGGRRGGAGDSGQELPPGKEGSLAVGSWITSLAG